MDYDIEEVRMSYGRSLSNRKLIDRFYEIFMASHPDIPKLFENTDFDKQKDLLSQSINMAILFPQKNKIATNAIDRISKTHSKENMDINPEFYPYWLDSLITTLSESDPEFTTDLERQWRLILQETIDHISKGYQ